MCGIAGYLCFTTLPAENDFHLAVSCMAHRGPDNSGLFQENSVGLGHRRLSIIDTSDAANQPFYSQNEDYVIVFNGEIYNYKELSEELNLILRTASDTEVLLSAYIRWGSLFVDKLNGMFAFAIYNRKEEKLWLYRDRVGIKPLYYSYSDGNFFFASEIKSVLKYNSVQKNTSLDLSAVSDFLHCGYIPEPGSIYTNIKQVKAGHFICVDKAGITETQYWNPYSKLKPQTLTDEKQALHELKELIVSSVNYRLICDVPFGAFLSGGIDSSLITAVAASLYPDKLKTFSIGFAEASHDESMYAEAVAKELGTNHHQFRVTEKEALELVNESLEMYDQPFADSSAIPTLLVSRMASDEVKMVLTGDGGDELFMGYGAYTWANRLNNPFLNVLSKPLSQLLPLGSSKYQRLAGLFKYPADGNIQSHIFSQEQYLFSRNEVLALLRVPHQNSTLLFNKARHVNRLLTAAEIQSFYDMEHYLKDDLLVKVDRASMRASLECRVPLLDYRILEWSLNLHPDLKVKGNISKYLLKKLLFTYLPEPMFNRPKKGFAVPLSKWLQGPLSYLIDEYLSDAAFEKTAVLNKSIGKELIRKYKSGKSDYLYNRIWTLIVLQKMLINNFN